MQKTPLGLDEETWEKRNEASQQKARSWKKGFKAGRKGKETTDNPYTLTPEIFDLLRKRTQWILGFEEGYAARKFAHQKHKRKHDREQIEHIKELAKKKKDKHKKHRKHKHHGH